MFFETATNHKIIEPAKTEHVQGSDKISQQYDTPILSEEIIIPKYLDIQEKLYRINTMISKNLNKYEAKFKQAELELFSQNILELMLITGIRKYNGDVVNIINTNKGRFSIVFKRNPANGDFNIKVYKGTINVINEVLKAENTDGASSDAVMQSPAFADYRAFKEKITKST